MKRCSGLTDQLPTTLIPYRFASSGSASIASMAICRILPLFIGQLSALCREIITKWLIQDPQYHGEPRAKALASIGLYGETDEGAGRRTLRPSPNVAGDQGFKSARRLLKSTMSEPPSGTVDLEPGEKLLRHWVVEPVRADGSTDRSGWLILTNHRCLFFRMAGVLGGRRVERPAGIVWRLEEGRSVSAQRFWMKIGYGDRVEMPGLALDGQGFRLNRETSSRAVVEEILKARETRRAEMGLPLP